MEFIQSKNTLCLSGRGYLEQVRVEKCRIRAQIKALIDAELTDEVLLDCDVDPACLQQIIVMESLREDQCTILLYFSCVYTGFVYHYPALTQDDPANMVKLKARLVRVEAWCCDGRRKYVDAGLAFQAAA